MDQISISPIVLLVVLLLTLAALGVAVFFSMRYKQFKDDLNEYCPEAETFIRGRKERKPVLAIHDSGSTYTRFLLGETENRASWTFKCEEFEVKFRPDFSSHCEADRFYGDLEVFHAAAHKHVPLMEKSPTEAIKNNVFGTYNTADMAEKYGVEAVPGVEISSDCGGKEMHILSLP